MTATAEAALAVAQSYLGVAESPPRSNRTIIGEKFSHLDGADAGNGVAWCAEFFSVCQIEAGNTEFKVSASCLTLVARYKDGTNGEWLGNPGTQGLQPGDEGFLGSNGGEHTFRVEYTEGDSVICIDGNWGDRVIRVVRPVASIHGFGRPNYGSPEPSPTPVPTPIPQESTMPAAFQYNNDLDTFYVDPSGKLKTRYYQPESGGTGWHLLSLGEGCTVGAIPVVVRDYHGSKGRLDVFVEAGVNGLAHAWFEPNTPNPTWEFEYQSN